MTRPSDSVLRSARSTTTQSDTYICQFGDRTLAFAFGSPHVDWRGQLAGVTIEKIDLGVRVRDQFRALSRTLGLRMAVMDAKLNADGDLVWFGANPRGQFSVSPGLCWI